VAFNSTKSASSPVAEVATTSTNIHKGKNEEREDECYILTRTDSTQLCFKTINFILQNNRAKAMQVATAVTNCTCFSANNL